MDRFLPPDLSELNEATAFLLIALAFLIAVAVFGYWLAISELEQREKTEVARRYRASRFGDL